MDRIDIYLKGHSDTFFKRKDVDEKFFNKNNYLHFTVSFDLLNFNSKKEAKYKLNLLLKMLLKVNINVKERNGYKILKDGTKKQKWRRRKIEIGEQILCAAVHIEGHDKNWFVNPHIHIIFDKKARLGKNYVYLRKTIMYIIKRYNLNITPSFAEKGKYAYINKKFKKVMSARFWAIRSGKNIKEKTLEKFEEDVIKFLKLSKNLEYALKAYKVLKQRDYFPVNLYIAIRQFAKEEPEILNKIVRKEVKVKVNFLDSLLTFADLEYVYNKTINNLQKINKKLSKFK